MSAAPIGLHGRRLVLGLYRDIRESKQAAAEIESLRQQLGRNTAASGAGDEPGNPA